MHIYYRELTKETVRESYGLRVLWPRSPTGIHVEQVNNFAFVVGAALDGQAIE